MLDLILYLLGLFLALFLSPLVLGFLAGLVPLGGALVCLGVCLVARVFGPSLGLLPGSGGSGLFGPAFSLVLGLGRLDNVVYKERW